MSSQTIKVAAGRITPLPEIERAKLQHRARLLAWGGIAWHFIEFAIALAAGIAAGSIALIGFGADSLIEAFAGFTVGHALSPTPKIFATSRTRLAETSRF